MNVGHFCVRDVDVAEPDESVQIALSTCMLAMWAHWLWSTSGGDRSAC